MAQTIGVSVPVNEETSVTADIVEDLSVTNFREYLRIATVHPDPNYEPAVEFLCRLAEDIGLQCQVVRVKPVKPVVIMTWPGTDPNLPTLILNSHMDVVPVFPENWKYEPFSAHKDEYGDIYARGSQDMKCVGIQYIEAIRRLKANGERCLRTIHLTFVPDEEISGTVGMALFVETPEFKKLNIGLSLDEGIASENDVYKIFYGERVKWHLKVTCPGNPGHGSKFIKNTAAEKLQKIINKFLAFRENQSRILESSPKLTLGDVTTVNLTIINGGVQVNVIPAEMIAEFDIRVTPLTDYDKLFKEFESWVRDVGAKAEWLELGWIKTTTPTDDRNPWWKAFSETMRKLSLPYKTEIFIGATDARFIRGLGYPAYGFSPMINTTQLLHDHNERLNEKMFLNGLDIYTKLIPALANVPSF